MCSAMQSMGNPLTNYLHPDKQVEIPIHKNPFMLDVGY
jgi:hypothetical protein